MASLPGPARAEDVSVQREHPALGHGDPLSRHGLWNEDHFLVINTPQSLVI